MNPLPILGAVEFLPKRTLDPSYIWRGIPFLFEASNGIPTSVFFCILTSPEPMLCRALRIHVVGLLDVDPNMWQSCASSDFEQYRRRLHLHQGFVRQHEGM